MRFQKKYANRDVEAGSFMCMQFVLVSFDILFLAIPRGRKGIRMRDISFTYTTCSLHCEDGRNWKSFGAVQVVVVAREPRPKRNIFDVEKRVFGKVNIIFPKSSFRRQKKRRADVIRSRSAPSRPWP